MSASGTLKLRAWGFLLAALGGFLIALGALMPWGTSTLGGTLTLHGIDSTIGLIVLVLGVVIVLGVFVMRFQSTAKRRKAIGIVLLIASVCALALTAWALVNIHSVVFSTSSDLADATDDISAEPGIYLPLVGSVVAIIGTILCLKWAKRRGEEDEAAAAADPALD